MKGYPLVLGAQKRGGLCPLSLRAGTASQPLKMSLNSGANNAVERLSRSSVSLSEAPVRADLDYLLRSFLARLAIAFFRFSWAASSFRGDFDNPPSAPISAKCARKSGTLMFGGIGLLGAIGGVACAFDRKMNSSAPFGRGPRGLSAHMCSDVSSRSSGVSLNSGHWRAISATNRRSECWSAPAAAATRFRSWGIFRSKRRSLPGAMTEARFGQRCNLGDR